MYFHRDIEPLLMKAVEQFPVVLLTGPRQAGKSTLLKKRLATYQYVTLDDPELRLLANNDPSLFLSTHKKPCIIDEIQYAPKLLSYIKMEVDKDRSQSGQYILTGSQIFQLMQGVSETLAGRIAIFHLYPFSWHEITQIAGKKEMPFDDLQMALQTVSGFYPEFLEKPELNWNIWYGSYLTTYIERDVRNIKAINDLARFQTFLSLLATRAGQLLNLSEIARDCGITYPTAKDWITILEATYIVFRLQPYYKNHSKRLVKSSKIYFLDTGLLCYLLGIDSAERFFKASERGNVFENMVIADWLKRLSVIEKKSSMYFYRTENKVEVDLLIDYMQSMPLSAYEIKLSKTPQKKMCSQLIKFQNEHSNVEAALLSLRTSSLPITNSIQAVHWSKGLLD